MMKIIIRSNHFSARTMSILEAHRGHCMPKVYINNDFLSIITNDNAALIPGYQPEIRRNLLQLRAYMQSTLGRTRHAPGSAYVGKLLWKVSLNLRKTSISTAVR